MTDAEIKRRSEMSSTVSSKKLALLIHEITREIGFIAFDAIEKEMKDTGNKGFNTNTLLNHINVMTMDVIKTLILETKDTCHGLAEEAYRLSEMVKQKEKQNVS